MSETVKKNPVLIDMPMPIVTPRLILRNVMPGDGKAMFEAKIETIDSLQKWMPWAKTMGSEEDSEIIARTNYARFILREDIMIMGFERDSGQKVISTGLHRMNWDLRTFEIGYWVRKSAQEKGYASESTNALLRYAFGALSATKVSICHAAGNDASARVIEKLGFIKEGIMRNDEILPDGNVTDRHWYARFNIEGLPDLAVQWGEQG